MISAVASCSYKPKSKTMETKALVVRTWDDLIFASRNREYGAYSIRKAYSRNLSIGLGISTALIAILFLAGDLVRDGKRNKGIPPVIEYKGLVKPIQPPVLEQRPPAAPIRRPQTVTNTNTTILVVTEPVPDAPIVTEPGISSPDGLVGGSDVAVTGDASGLSDIPVVEVPAQKDVVIAEVMPVYEGGYQEMIRFLRANLKYPASARRMGIEGSVYVSFVVNGDGTVRDVSVLRGISADCDKEAARVISLLPGWIGGRQNGSPVGVKMVLPVKFSLSK
jgi:protein TonB